MNKNLRKKTIGVMAAGLVLTASVGAAAYAKGNAYDDFKAAVVKTSKIENSTLNSNIQVTQNGKVTASGKVEWQSAGENQYSSGQFTVGGKTVDTEQSTSGDQTVLREGDQYYSIDHSEFGMMEDSHDSFESSPSAIRLAEAASDLLIGDVKNRFTENGDTIKLSLTDAQIPELANLALNAVLEASAQHEKQFGYDENDDSAAGFDIDKKALFPIVSNGRVESVQLEAKVADGTITAIQTKITVSGLDESGKNIKVEASIDSTLSNIGNTKPKTMDVKGKKVETFDHEEFGGDFHGKDRF
ncbi:hypothetical protein [Saccharibacillus sp. JS10]|uniref:hypothetical protein n=1 Tax=Saccharibacillus sp. JS10 TaxID=2950552 RepID=UPI00210A91E9|nr:hypothetical protein [Saccharibacillus sp. JS10]MCQ4088241.1 hypothetical protein [Saccharibacillus sp. JS10]